MPLLVISVNGQTSQDDIFGDFDENANFDDFTPDMSKPSDDFLAQMMAIGTVTYSVFTICLHFPRIFRGTPVAYSE